jgi:5-methylthioadenosine/S-adenosylhomocysteine deaminase
MQDPAADVVPQSVDCVVTGCVVTMNENRDILADGGVAVSDGSIVAVGPRDDILRRFTASDRLGGPRTVVLPGMIDCHTHCTACFTRSLAAGELPMIPRIYNPAQRCHTPDETRNAIRLIVAQLLHSGVTTVCEGSLIPDQEEAMLEALDEVGIRCSFARGATDQDFYHAALYTQVKESSWVKPRAGEAERDMAKTESLLQRYPPRGRQLIRGAISPSALPGFSEEYFRLASDLARRLDASVQVHVDRDREEVELSMAVWGCRPIERLAEIGVVDERLVAIHAVLATKREIDILGAAGSTFAHSPIEAVCNLNAIPNVQAFRTSGVKVGLGCDNQANDMFETMRATWLIHGAMWGIPTYDAEYLPPADILAMATIEAARVLRLDDIAGSLEEGKAADLVVLDGTAPHLMSMQDVVSEIVRYATRAEVTDVMVHGRLLVSGGNLTTIDAAALLPEAEAAGCHVRETVLGRRYRPMASPSPWFR